MKLEKSEKWFLEGCLNTIELMNKKALEELKSHEKIAIKKAKKEIELGRRLREKLKREEDRGITKITCKKCKGTGIVKWHGKEEKCLNCNGTGYEYVVEGKDEVDNEMLIVCLRGGSYHSMIRVRWNDLTNEKGDNLNMDMTNAVEAVYEYLWKIIGEGVVVEWVK